VSGETRRRCRPRPAAQLLTRLRVPRSGDRRRTERSPRLLAAAVEEEPNDFREFLLPPAPSIPLEPPADEFERHCRRRWRGRGEVTPTSSSRVQVTACHRRHPDVRTRRTADSRQHLDVSKRGVAAGSVTKRPGRDVYRWRKRVGVLRSCAAVSIPSTVSHTAFADAHGERSPPTVGVLRSDSCAFPGADRQAR
jgi:hypothetical protein